MMPGAARAPLVMALLLAATAAAAGPAGPGAPEALAPPEAPAGAPSGPPAWSKAGAPGAAAVQGLGGAGGVLVASTFTEGAWRSLDDGMAWERIAAFPPVARGRVAFDPADARVGYVAGSGGVARTLDGGATWEHVLAVPRAPRIDVGPTGLVLAGARHADGSNHVLLSADRGTTWADLGAPIPAGEPLCGVAFGRGTQEVLAMTDRASWYTHDGGLTWTATEGAGFDFAAEDGGVVWRSDMRRLERTLDGGATWEPASPPGFGTAIGPRPGGGVYLATTQGLLATTDGGATWSSLGHGNAMLLAQGVFAPPWAPDAPFVADERVGIARLAPDGAGGGAYQGRTQGLPPVPLAVLGGHPSARLLLAAGERGLYASPGGMAWQHTGAGIGHASLRAAASAPDGSTGYAGGRSAFGLPLVEATRDHGASFEAVELPGGAGEVRALAVDPAEPLRAYAGLARDDLTGALLRTGDGGRTWAEVLAPPAPVHALAWDGAADALLVGTDAGVLALDRQGLWTPRGGARALAVAWAEGATVAAGPGLGVWRGEAMAPLLPWADARAPVALAAGGGAAWAADAMGQLRRCIPARALGACDDAGAPGVVRGVLVAGGRAWAAGPWGLAWAAG